MSLQRQECLEEIKQWLVRLESSIVGDKALQHQNSSIQLEGFFRDLLNLLFGWNLKNANALFGLNQDSFDLSDESEGLAAQVTVSTDAAKIRDTLTTFIGTHDATYKRLIFVYPRIAVGETRADFGRLLNGYDFDPRRDRISLGAILRKAQQEMDIDKQMELRRFSGRSLLHWERRSKWVSIPRWKCSFP